MEGDPRFVAARKLRAKGRNEAAVQMLSDLLLAATEGKTEEEQVTSDLAPLYYEYGCALACAARRSHDDGGQRKKQKIVDDDDDSDDGKLAWQVLDQARCIYERTAEADDTDDASRRQSRSELARCCVQLGDLNFEDEEWGDAIVEYTNCVEVYEARGPPYDLDDDKRFTGALVGAALAYLRCRATDVVVGDGILVAPADETLDRAASLVAAAEKRLDRLLTRRATDDAADDDTKRDVCALAIEVQAAKDALLAAQDQDLP